MLRHYPRSDSRPDIRSQNTPGLDSLLQDISEIHYATASSLPDSVSPKTLRNPFRLPMMATTTASAGASRPAAPPPPRSYILHGMVGGRVATISDNSGRKRIVAVGDRLDSAEVVAIDEQTVTLRDRAGRFELGRNNSLP